MKIVKIILKILLGLFMIYGGVQHFLKPDFYLAFAKTPLNVPYLIIYASGVIEVLLGISLFIKKYSHIGAMGIFILMLVFLPIHVLDVFRDSPAMGSHEAALIRLPVQFLFIAWAWGIMKWNK